MEEKLKMEKPEKVSWEYDPEADVLYISFGDPQPALSIDFGSGIIARYLEKSGKIVGFTIMGLQSVLKAEKH